jgi:hypothetical protein
MRDREEAIKAVEGILASVPSIALAAKRRDRRLEIAVLASSAITTGSLWALISGLAPQFTA